jgi:hypothetical protein
MITNPNRLLPGFVPRVEWRPAFIVVLDENRADRETLADCVGSLGGTQDGLRQDALDRTERIEKEWDEKSRR